MNDSGKLKIVRPLWFLRVKYYSPTFKGECMLVSGCKDQYSYVACVMCKEPLDVFRPGQWVNPTNH